MFFRFSALIFLFFAFVMCMPAQTFAQDNQVKSLGEILNQPTEDDEWAGDVNSSTLANRFFKGCVAEENLALLDQEKELLCGCMSAKMSENLTVSELKTLKADTPAGKDARSKALAFAFAPCVPYVVEGRIKDDCMISPAIQDIIRGKAKICNCVTEKFNAMFDNDLGFIINEAVKYDPMSLNPLERYFRGRNYEAQHKMYTKQCSYKFRYERDN